jgi:hypothetical protein
MAFVTKEEHMAKIDRIIDLSDEGFNVPRFRYIDQNSSKEKLKEILRWAKGIWEKVPEGQIFNIRTYNYMPNAHKEVTSCPHICDLKMADLKLELAHQNMSYTCMIDAEIPDNGRIAGNIFVPKNVDDEFTVEFVIKPKRAMVRDVNTDEGVIRIENKQRYVWKWNDPNGWLKQVVARDDKRFTDEVCDVIAYVIRKANTFYKKGIVFEWTYFCEPAGIQTITHDSVIPFPGRNVVWWEYRKM